MSKEKKFVALLRGINVGGKNIVPMKELVELCSGMGLKGVETYLQTGNIIFSTLGCAEALEAKIEKVILKGFGLDLVVIVREANSYASYIARNPFIEQTLNEPSRVLLYLTKRPTGEGIADILNSRAKAGETVVVVDSVIWIYFPNGVGSSKLTPTVMDRVAGSSTTGRNWNTVSKLKLLLSE